METSEDQQRERPTPARANAYVFMLAVLIALSLLDRQLLSIVAEPVKLEFKLSDTQLGLLTGAVFALMFALFSIPVAWAADRMSRTGILTVCATFWAICTGAVGFASSFTHLALTRMGLAIGEAGCNPCSQSLIADYVPPERRGQAMAVYTMGGPAGVIAAGFLGGALTDWYGWRVAFFVLGGVSLAAALVASVVLPEPARQKAATKERPIDDGGYRRLLSKSAFRYLIAGSALLAIAIYGNIVWGTVFAVRYFGWTPGEAGAIFGTLGAVVALGGTWLGGKVSDRLILRDVRWPMWLSSIVLMAATPFSVTSALSGSVVLLLAAAVGDNLFRTMSFAPAAATLQNLSPNSARARAAATAGVMGTLVGLGLGPTFVGVVSDQLQPFVGGEGLRYGIAVLAVPQLVAAYCFWQAAATLKEEVEG